MRVHVNKDRLRPRGVRLRESTWAELELIRIRRGQDSVQETLREAAELLIETERLAPSRAA